MATNSKEELIMIRETSLGFIATLASPPLNEVPFHACITINRGLNSWGRIALVVVIHETSVDVNTKYWHHIAPELAFPTA